MPKAHTKMLLLQRYALGDPEFRRLFSSSKSLSQKPTKIQLDAIDHLCKGVSNFRLTLSHISLSFYVSAVQVL